LKKLGFADGRLDQNGRTVRLRIADSALLDRLIRKYDLNDLLVQHQIKLPEKKQQQAIIPQQVDRVDGAKKGSNQAVFSAQEDTPAANEAQNTPVSGPSTTSTSSTTSGIKQALQTTALDTDHEAALQRLKRRQDGYASYQDAVGAVMGLGFDRDLASMLVNHLIRDSLFGLYPDERWRVVETRDDAQGRGAA